MDNLYFYEDITAEKVDLMDSELENKPWVSEKRTSDCEEVEFN